MNKILEETLAQRKTRSGFRTTNAGRFSQSHSAKAADLIKLLADLMRLRADSNHRSRCGVARDLCKSAE